MLLEVDGEACQRARGVEGHFVHLEAAVRDATGPGCAHLHHPDRRHVADAAGVLVGAGGQPVPVGAANVRSNQNPTPSTSTWTVLCPLFHTANRVVALGVHVCCRPCPTLSPG